MVMENTTENSKPPKDLRLRTREFAVRIISLYTVLAKSDVGRVIGRQVLRAGTSVGAQYHEGCRARSPAEFVSKLESALQELEETQYWLALTCDANLMSTRRLSLLQQECNELIAIFTASVKQAKTHLKRKT
ncbi:MAG TPA: four helix bundle protein [Planctomycetota bacterium]|nr:four helix bundle protein [Planctomycetota bacterium]